MRYWDASAILPLLIPEAASEAIAAIYRQDPEMLTWWGTEIECVSALCRLERERPSALETVEGALGRLDRLKCTWHEIQPTSRVRETSRRLLRVHPLRAADSLQLAAAIVGSEGIPSSLDVVCLDRRLRDAARKEGFRCLGE